MTPAELETALFRVGLSQAAFARRFGAQATTVNRWCRATRPIPAWVPEVMRMLAAERDKPPQA